jgi:hypothetical protein
VTSSEKSNFNSGCLTGFTIGFLIAVIIFLTANVIFAPPSDDTAKLQFALQTGQTNFTFDESSSENGRLYKITVDGKPAIEFCYTELFKGGKCVIGRVWEAPTPTPISN